MKTSEFIKKLDEHSYKINGLYTKYLFQDVFERTIETDQFSITYQSDTEPDELIKIIAEYLNTPVSEREEEKKYYLRQIGINEYNNYLNLEYDTQSCYVSSNEEFYDYKTKFTQEEIDNMPECYTHPAVWEQVEVESEEE